VGTYGSPRDFYLKDVRTSTAAKMLCLPSSIVNTARTVLLLGDEAILGLGDGPELSIMTLLVYLGMRRKRRKLSLAERLCSLV
jgi:hypothetical protein